jgi:hypothetical protein|tara:strand:+ start:1356 stop:1898 length:543 start_codon:yes stop_codon:yes gene_type:complete
MNSNFLYVGLDDSNHAGCSKGEIIVSVFSSIQEDSLVKGWGNGRLTSSRLEDFFKDEERDFRFTLLTDEKYRRGSQNLPQIAPYLIKSYLEEENIEVDTLKIYLDGVLKSHERKKLKEQFLDVPNLVVDNFIKKQRMKKNKRIVKGHHCPRTVYVADSLANNLYKEPIGKLLEHEKMINI